MNAEGNSSAAHRNKWVVAVLALIGVSAMSTTIIARSHDQQQKQRDQMREKLISLAATSDRMVIEPGTMPSTTPNDSRQSVEIRDVARIKRIFDQIRIQKLEPLQDGGKLAAMTELHLLLYQKEKRLAVVTVIGGGDSLMWDSWNGVIELTPESARMLQASLHW